MSTNFSSPQIQWFFGRVTSVAAQLYIRVRYADTRAHAPILVNATISGPRSLHARTLETSVQLVSVAGDKTLWQATLEDPCFWTLRQPYVYLARLTIAAPDGSREELSLTLGVPVLMARENRLELEGKNWTLRAFRAERPDSSLLASCHESGTSLLVDCLDDELCEVASHEGVLLVADLSAIPAGDFESELRRVARWPAVGVAILPEAAEVDRRLRQETSHVIHAQNSSLRQPISPREWAQALIVPREAIQSDRELVPPGLAIIARYDGWSPPHAAVGASEHVDSATQVALGRQACDSLQAELAGHGDLAGYVVG